MNSEACMWGFKYRWKDLNVRKEFECVAYELMYVYTRKCECVRNHNLGNAIEFEAEVFEFDSPCSSTGATYYVLTHGRRVIG